MSTPPPLPPLADRVMNAISNNHLAPKPRWHFFLQSVLLIACITALALIALSLASLLLFSLAQHGAFDLPLMDRRAWAAVFFSLPPYLLLSILVIIITLGLLSRSFDFANRRPRIVTAVLIILTLTIGTMLIHATKIHEFIEQRVNATGEIFISPAELGGRYVLRVAIGEADLDQTHAFHFDEINRHHAHPGSP